MQSWGFCTFGAGVDVNEGEKQDKPQVKLNSSPHEDIFTWNTEVTHFSFCTQFEFSCTTYSLVPLVFLHIYEKPEEMTCMNYNLNVKCSSYLKIPLIGYLTRFLLIHDHV